MEGEPSAEEPSAAMEVDGEADGGGGGAEPTPPEEEVNVVQRYWDERTHSDDEADEALTHTFPQFHYGEVRDALARPPMCTSARAQVLSCPHSAPPSLCVLTVSPSSKHCKRREVSCLQRIAVRYAIVGPLLWVAAFSYCSSFDVMLVWAMHVS